MELRKLITGNSSYLTPCLGFYIFSLLRQGSLCIMTDSDFYLPIQPPSTLTISPET